VESTGGGQVEAATNERKFNGPTWRMLYLFAGPARKSDLGNSIKEIVQEHNVSNGTSFTIEIESVDILRGGAEHDLDDEERQNRYKQDLMDGWYNLVVAAPPCSTFSRALFSDRSLPRPLRDFANPWGKPGLTDNERLKVDSANRLVQFSAEIMAIAGSLGALCLLEFPEDLGECREGTPANLWTLYDGVGLDEMGLARGAFHQCEWGNPDAKKPTGLLTNVDAILREDGFHMGWPSFAAHAADGRGRKYLGPLPPECTHGGKHPDMIGKTAEGEVQN